MYNKCERATTGTTPRPIRLRCCSLSDALETSFFLKEGGGGASCYLPSHRECCINSACCREGA